MISVVPFETWHLEILDPWGDPAFSTLMRESAEYRWRLHQSGPAFSGFTETGAYIGTLGFIKYPWGTTADCWMALDRNVARCRKEFHRFMLERVENAFEVMGVTRLQAIVSMSDERALRWIGALGFERETMECGMRGFGPGGESVHLYARVVDVRRCSFP